jgi:KDO2-lipid IV(A) lauroyltransferase
LGIDLFSRLLSCFSFQALYKISRILGFILYKILKIRRRLILDNLNIAFPTEYSSKKKDEIGYESVISFIYTELEFLAARNGALSETVRFEGEDKLLEALRQGKGVYVLCIHIGSWEATGAAITRKIKPAHVIVKKVGGPRTDHFIRSLREKNGFLSIKREKRGDAFKAISDILSRGEIVGFVMDQARPGEPHLPFFGRPAKTNTSFSGIWKKRPAPIVPCWSIRTSPGQYTVGFGDEIIPVVTGDEKADHIHNSIEFNRIVETLIRKCPSQYFWLHNRWKP